MRRHYELNNIFQWSDARRQAQEHLIRLRAVTDGSVTAHNISEAQANFDNIARATELQNANFQSVAEVAEYFSILLGQ